MEHSYDVIIIGGGAGGMTAAVFARMEGARVLVIEKNRYMGEKLKITGGGRCNVTNNTPDIHTFLKNYGESAKYLYSPFAQFGVKDTFEFFESRGLPLVTQARDRVFPQTEKALDVFNVLEKEMKRLGVVVKTNSPVKKILREGDKITGVEVVGGTVYTASSYILATGGVSHPETGSTGDGFKWLTGVHSVQQPTPSVVPLKVAETWVNELSGVTLSFMKITFLVDGKKAFSKTGKILFTHFGLSSPLILNSATQVAELLPLGEVVAVIDMYPDTDIGALDKKIVSAFDQNKNKNFKNIIKEITPDGMHDIVLKILTESGLDPEMKVHSISKDQRRAIVEILKGLRFTITGLMGFDRAVVSDGGVPLSEVDTKTMRSKKIANLFLVGDLLHVNRPSGGFSLQLCWTTGYVAGKNASHNV